MGLVHKLDLELVWEQNAQKLKLQHSIKRKKCSNKVICFAQRSLICAEYHGEWHKN